MIPVILSQRVQMCVLLRRRRSAQATQSGKKMYAVAKERVRRMRRSGMKRVM